MKKAIALLAVLSLVAFAGQLVEARGTAGSSDGDWLQYDDSTPHWLTWGGVYRGVWFNLDDFSLDWSSCLISQAEMWFYHHSSYPWDTSDFYAELYDGDAMGTGTMLDQRIVQALHGVATIIDYDPAVETAGDNFWGVCNVEFSSGGWPAIRCDNTESTLIHSFLSEDAIVWEPWDPFGTGGVCLDYFIRLYVDPQALDGITWGSLKATF